MVSEVCHHYNFAIIIKPLLLKYDNVRKAFSLISLFHNYSILNIQDRCEIYSQNNFKHLIFFVENNSCVFSPLYTLSKTPRHLHIVSSHYITEMKVSCIRVMRFKSNLKLIPSIMEIFMKWQVCWMINVSEMS